ncbi:MAG: M42 family metallopeptidase [Clostridia bacterium]
MDCITEFKKLTSIPSPSGFTNKVAEYTKGEFEKLGFCATLTKKGCVCVELGGEGNPLVLSAHIDTLGGMVCEIKGNGRLRISRIGGLQPQNIEGENCQIFTRTGKTYTGCMQLDNASSHVNGNYATKERTFDTMEVVIDQKTSSKLQTEQLGISCGDYVCFDPRTVLTDSGYLKSRFIDDKLSVAILLNYANYIAENNIVLPRKVYVYITVFEEVGHGCASFPYPYDDILCVDMGCVGDGLTCDEHAVSICAKDSSGPYNYDLTTKLIECAKANNLNYAVDVYPHYGSDASAALSAGYDVRHALIGSGVYASHGYERTHLDGIANTLSLIKHFISNQK